MDRYISLKQIFTKIALENINIDIICLIKPQFEAGKAIATKYKGIILNKEIHVSIINDLINYFNSSGFYIKDLTFSPITGGDGNIEYLAYVSNKVKENKRLDVKKIVTNAFKNNK